MSDRTDEEGVPATIYAGPSGITQTLPTLPLAPLSAGYVVVAADPTLTGERVLTAGTGVTLTDAGAGSTLTLAATGVAAPDHLDFPGQTGALAATVIIAGAAAGTYLVGAAIDVSTAAAAGTIAANAIYADSAGAKTRAIFTGFPLTAADDNGDSIVIVHAGGDIKVSTTVVGLVGVPVYSASFRILRL